MDKSVSQPPLPPPPRDDFQQLLERRRRRPAEIDAAAKRVQAETRALAEATALWRAETAVIDEARQRASLQQGIILQATMRKAEEEVTIAEATTRKCAAEATIAEAAKRKSADEALIAETAKRSRAEDAEIVQRASARVRETLNMCLADAHMGDRLYGQLVPAALAEWECARDALYAERHVHAANATWALPCVSGDTTLFIDEEDSMPAIHALTEARLADGTALFVSRGGRIYYERRLLRPFRKPGANETLIVCLRGGWFNVHMIVAEAICAHEQTSVVQIN